jgi:hypothetical protein
VFFIESFFLRVDELLLFDGVFREKRAKILSGPFIPAGPHKLADPSMRSMLPEILLELQRILLNVHHIGQFLDILN